MHDWVDRLPRDERRYRERRAQDVRYLVIHHSGVGVETTMEELADAHREEWPGLLFDFFIDAQGEVFQTQPLSEVVDSTKSM